MSGAEWSPLLSTTALQGAEWALPVEETARGAYRPLRPEAVSMPERGAFVDVASLVEEVRPDLAAALRDPVQHVHPDRKLEDRPKVGARSQVGAVIRYYCRLQEIGCFEVKRAAEVPHDTDGEPLGAELFDVAKDKDNDQAIADRRKKKLA